MATGRSIEEILRLNLDENVSVFCNLNEHSQLEIASSFFSTNHHLEKLLKENLFVIEEKIIDCLAIPYSHPKNDKPTREFVLGKFLIDLALEHCMTSPNIKSLIIEIHTKMKNEGEFENDEDPMNDYMPDFESEVKFDASNEGYGNDNKMIFGEYADKNGK